MAEVVIFGGLLDDRGRIYKDFWMTEVGIYKDYLLGDRWRYIWMITV